MVRDQRRLAAILAADVVGYSRLVGRDESGTIGRLRVLRQQRLQPVVDRHDGRVVKLTGDGVLIEFGSAVDALSAAMQKAMAAPGFKDKFRAAAVGMEPVANSPEEMLAIAKKDGEKTTKIIRDANIKID